MNHVMKPHSRNRAGMPIAATATGCTRAGFGEVTKMDVTATITSHASTFGSSRTSQSVVKRARAPSTEAHTFPPAGYSEIRTRLPCAARRMRKPARAQPENRVAAKLREAAGGERNADHRHDPHGREFVAGGG